MNSYFGGEKEPSEYNESSRWIASGPFENPGIRWTSALLEHKNRK